MRKLFLIAGSLLALAAAPHSSAQRQALPSRFGTWSCRPSAENVEFTEPEKFANLKKEAGLTTSEICDYYSGDSRIRVDLDKYRDPSSAYEIYTAYLRPDMQPSTLNRTSAVDGDKLYVLLGSFILQVSPTPAISTEDLVTLVNTVGAHSDQIRHLAQQGGNILRVNRHLLLIAYGITRCFGFPISRKHGCSRLIRHHASVRKYTQAGLRRFHLSLAENQLVLAAIQF